MFKELLLCEIEWVTKGVLKLFLFHRATIRDAFKNLGCLMHAKNKTKNNGKLGTQWEVTIKHSNINCFLFISASKFQKINLFCKQDKNDGNWYLVR